MPTIIKQDDLFKIKNSYIVITIFILMICAHCSNSHTGALLFDVGMRITLVTLSGIAIMNMSLMNNNRQTHRLSSALGYILLFLIVSFNGIFTLIIKVLNVDIDLFFSDTILSSLFWFTILYWTIVLFQIPKANHSNRFLDFVSSFWLVSGVLITLGTSLFDFSFVPINLFLETINSILIKLLTTIGISATPNNSLQDLFDVRTIVSILVLIIFISKALRYSRREIVNIDIPRIDIPKIKPVDFNERNILTSFIKISINYSNIIVRIISVFLNCIWKTASYIITYIFVLIVSLFENIYSYFFNKDFFNRIRVAFSIPAILFLFILLSAFQNDITEYIKTTHYSSSFNILLNIVLMFIGVMVLSLLISICSRYITFGAITCKRLKEQVHLGVEYLLSYAILIAISSWIGWFVTNKNIFNIFPISFSIGIITIVVSVFVCIAIIFAVTKTLLQK